MARFYTDGAGTTYDAATAKFNNVGFGYTAAPTTAAPAGTAAANAYIMHDFGTTVAFAQKVDMSLAGEMRDCGECHVGGGFMEYARTPQPGGAVTVLSDGTVGTGYNPAQRTSLRDVNFGSTVTAFNYLIDIFNNSTSARKNVIQNNYAETGVMEMDCLMCHYDGYNWEHRKEAVRKGEFDASRAVGAGLTTAVTNGVTVTYDPALVKTNAAGELYVDFSNKLVSSPPSQNCASCHLTQYNVDWKKRGDMWLAGEEVHFGLGCMACHERTDRTFSAVGTSGLPSSNVLSLCDPAKGGASPFDAMWNPMDKTNFKDCAGCHDNAAPTYPTYGAPAKATVFSAHSALGLTNKIVYDKAGVAKSHVDIIDCTACHIKKSDAYTGGAWVDGTGADEEGRVALHDQPEVAKPMGNGVGLHWQGGKLYAANMLTSMFWRDMNNLTNGLDVNNDGRTAGVDGLLQTHVNNINNQFGRHALAADGDISIAEITQHQNDIKAGIWGLINKTAPVATDYDSQLLLKLSSLMVPFKQSHNIGFAKDAKGAGGCADCHAANKGFYNGAYPILGNLTGHFTYNSTQVANFTKVNGLSDPTDSHPNVITKEGSRTMPVVLFTANNPYNTVNVTAGVKNMDRAELLYEAMFKKLNTAWYDDATPIVGDTRLAACTDKASPFYCGNPNETYNLTAADNARRGSTSTLGWLVKIDTTADNGTTIVSRTKQVSSGTIASVDQLITNLGAAFCTGFEFNLVAIDTNSDTVNDALQITAKPGYKVRISKQADVGPLGFNTHQYPTDPIVRTDARALAYADDLNNLAPGTSTSISFAGRTQYVNYLNTFGAAPVAAIAASTPAEGKVGTAVTFAATDQNNPNFEYSWTFSDNQGAASGMSVTRSFPSATYYVATLHVKNKLTNAITTAKKTIAIKANLPATTVATPSLTGRTVTLALSGMPAHTKIQVLWGDGSSNTYTTSAATYSPKHIYYGTATGFTATVKVVATSGVVDQVQVVTGL